MLLDNLITPTENLSRFFYFISVLVMEEAILKPRHSLSHILAQAVQRTIDPSVKLGIGPAIDSGFYYDFIFSEGVEFKEDNLKELNKMMTKIVKESQLFHRIDLKYEQAKEIITMLGAEFKIELIDEFKAEGETNFSYYINTIPLSAKDNLLKGSTPEYLKKYEDINTYIRELWIIHSDFWIESKFITFIDMCEGPHVENTKEINVDAFKLDKIAGAYWRGNEKNPMMTRIYWLAFEDKEALKAYVEMMEEARKRDHRILGQKLELFVFNDEIGPGLPLWLPKWNIIKEELEKWAKETEEKWGYQRVTTPIITKDKLFYTSWHLPLYKSSMYSAIKIEEENYYIKPMNCPFHHKIFSSLPRSYKELPLRLAEYGWCHRYEDSGSLFGLMRVRGMQMNDAHIYTTQEQAKEEFINVIRLHEYYYKTLGIEKYEMELSLRDPKNMDKYHGEESDRKLAEDMTIAAMKESGVPFKIVNEGAAFYGPKMDFQIYSSIGRPFTASTNQLDLYMGKKFALEYTDKDWSKKIPYIIHRAPLGTHERFIWFLIEHFAGAFPLWLAPVQIQLVPVAEKFIDYANTIKLEMKEKWIRVSVDDWDDSFSKKIRNAEVQKIPYIIIVGEKEESTKTLSIREYRSKKQYEISIDEFVDRCLVEIKTRRLEG